jgi:hypothetical protein
MRASSRIAYHSQRTIKLCVHIHKSDTMGENVPAHSKCTLFYERPLASLSAAFLRARRVISICEMRLILLFCGRRRTNTHTHTQASPLAGSGLLRPSVFNTLISARLRRRLLDAGSLSLSFPDAQCVWQIYPPTPHTYAYFFTLLHTFARPQLWRGTQRKRADPNLKLFRSGRQLE